MDAYLTQLYMHSMCCQNIRLVVKLVLLIYVYQNNWKTIYANVICAHEAVGENEFLLH